MTSQGKLHVARPRTGRVAAALCLCGLLHACSSVPGETLAPREARGAASDKVLQQARAAHPACKSPRIVDTEVLELHPDARVAVERWTVEHCGERSRYHVLFPPKGNVSGVQVRPE
jgi:hypothetical protein